MHSSAMPAMSAIFSGPVSVGLLAGVVSGLFYLVVAGIRWAGRLRAAQEREARQRQRLLQGLPEEERQTTETRAGDHEEDGAAGDFNARGREVKQQSEEWLYRQVQRRLHPTSSERQLCSVDNGLGMEPEHVRVREFIERLVESLVAGELDNVCIKHLYSHPDYDRMFACHHAPLCEALARLSFALQMAIANKPMADRDSPSAAHAALKLLIHQIIQEAMTLPKFKGVRPTEDDMKSLEEMESKTYEDILATAILNKVIERYQERDSNGRAALDGNRNLLSPELMSLVAMHQPRLFSNSESGVSMRSSDDGRLFYNDCDSMSESSNTGPLSVTIEECIHEVTTISKSDEEEDDELDSGSYMPSLDVYKKRRAPFPEYGRDIVDGLPLDISDEGEDEDEVSEDETSIQPTDIINPVDSWEENWLFQKRRLKVGGVQQPMPVPMLVPNPSEGYRALIGDRDAEDVSDLSDCSDGALEDVMLSEDITDSIPVEKNIPQSTVNTQENITATLVDNVDSSPQKEIDKTVKNDEVDNDEVDKHSFNTETALNDGVKGVTYDIRELDEAKNTEYLKTATEDCLSEFGQQEGEYTEDYDALTQRQMDSLTALSDTDIAEVPELPSSPIPQLSSEISTMDESVVAILEGLVPGESDTDQAPVSSLSSTELAKPPRPGTIAEREHKKWETASPIPNNPYSQENIIKRLNRKYPYNRTMSSSDASVDFLESKEAAAPEKVVEQPLQVICSPNDVDHKRYGRDYYINAPPVAYDKKKQSNPPDSEQQEFYDENGAEFAVSPSDSSNGGVNSTEYFVSKDIETKVALWQQEINETDQYYKNILNKKQEQTQDLSSDDYNHQTDSSSFHKSMLKNGTDHHDNDENENVKPKNKNKLRDRLKEFEKMERNGTNFNEEKPSLNKANFEHKARKSDSNLETHGMLRRNTNMGSSFSLNENGNDVYSNGYARSDSPSGSSVLSSNSDFSMPSVRELTKRFSGVLDSDSSTSSPQSVSPAPQLRKRDIVQKMRDERKMEPQVSSSSLSPPRAVREIHSLTARSISKEFREELRHNQPVALNKNIYRQINPKFTNGLTNGIDEENSTSGDARVSSAPKSPVPCRSMQSSIAFWEQMQKNKP